MLPQSIGVNPPASSFTGKNKTKLVLGLLLLFYLVSGIATIRSQSVTADENSFFLYAKRWARGNPERIDPATDDSKTPVVALNLIPRTVTQIFHPGLHKTDNGVSDIITARYITLFFSLLTLLLVFTWARESFGKEAGLFAVFLLALEPSFLANSVLVTTDSYSAFFLLASLYTLRKCLSVRSWRWLLIFSTAVAFAQLVKQSLAHLYLVLPLIVLCSRWLRPFPRPARIFQCLIVFIFIQWVVINLGYYFFGFGTPLGEYHFFSAFFRSVQGSLPAGFRVPLPRPFLQAFDMTRYYDETGGGIPGKSGFGNVTILGRSFRGQGIWYYYFVSLFFKAPVTFIILFFWAARRVLVRKFSDRATVLYLLIPPGYFLIYFSFFYQVQIGVRHIVFLVPLLCIFLSSLVLSARPAAKRILLPVLSLYLLCSYLFYWQAHYSYTNELITNKTFAYRYVGASNLDYGQGRYQGDQYLQSHAGTRWADSVASPGRFLVPVQQYMDIYNEHKLDWLKARPPLGQVAFSNLLVEVKPEDLRAQ